MESLESAITRLLGRASLACLLAGVLQLGVTPAAWAQSNGTACPSGYTNTGTNCFRPSDDYVAPSRLADCPRGYTNTGVACSASVIDHKPLSAASCPSGYFRSNLTGRCHQNCRDGYTSVGEACHRPASTLRIETNSRQSSGPSYDPGRRTMDDAANESERCQQAVQGRVAWNREGDRQWNPNNLRALCEGTPDHRRTISCFENAIATGQGWADAISSCKGGESSGTPPRPTQTPPPEPPRNVPSAPTYTGTADCECRGLCGNGYAGGDSGSRSRSVSQEYLSRYLDPESIAVFQQSRSVRSPVSGWTCTATGTTQPNDSRTGASASVGIGRPNSQYGDPTAPAPRANNNRPEPATRSRDGSVVLTADCNYGGYNIALSAGGYRLNDLMARGIKNDDVSGVRVPPGYVVQLFEHDDFQGRSITLNSSVDCLIQRQFNDVVSSVIVRTQ